MQDSAFTEAPIARLVLSLGLPATVSTVCTAVFVVADTFFIAPLGTQKLAAVGVVFALQALLQAFGFCFGLGAGTLTAHKLGEGDTQGAKYDAATSLCAALVTGLLLAVAGIRFRKELMLLLGAPETVLADAQTYALYILPGAPFVCASFVLNNLLRAQGRATLAMLGQAGGGVAQLLLEPFLLYAVRLGITGAAVANLIGQLVSFLLLLVLYLKNDMLSVQPRYFRIRCLPAILREGFPTFFRQVLASASALVLNRVAARFGDAAIAAMSVAGKIMSVLYAAALGVGQGFMPVAGQNYGAGKPLRVRRAFSVATVYGTALLTAAAIPIFWFAPRLVGLFRAADAPMQRIAVRTLRAQCVAIPTLSLSICVNMLYQSLAKPVRAALLSSCRNGLLFIPLLLTLPRFFSLDGILFAQAAADGLTFLLSIPFCVSVCRKLRSEITHI